MHNAEFYRRQAAKARQLARLVHDTAVSAELWASASHYDDLAEDLDADRMHALDYRRSWSSAAASPWY